MNEPKKILIADDHKIFLDGLNLILNEINHIKIVAQASNGKEAIEAFKNIEIDIAIIDLNMNDFSGIDLISALKSIQPKCKIIVLSMVDDSSIIKSLLNNYIDAYVIKYGGKQELLDRSRYPIHFTINKLKSIRNRKKTILKQWKYLD